MKIRLVASTTIAAVAFAGLGSASAAPACKLFEDPAGDTFATRAQDTAGVYGPQEDAFDLLSGDIATNAKTITAVIRVAKLAKTAATSPVGLQYRMQFTIPTLDDDTNLWMGAQIEGGTTEKFQVGKRAIAANLATKTGDVTGVFDLAKNEIRIHAPLSAFAEFGGIKNGTKISLSDLDQTASRYTGVANPVTGAPVAAFADVVVGEKTYTAGRKTCVAVGK